MGTVVEIEAPEKALARRVETWPEMARALVVADQSSLEIAGDQLKSIKALRFEIEATFGPIIAKAFATHREAVAQRKRIEAPLEEAERLIKSSVTGYLEAQEHARREEERRLREEVERKAAEEMERQIEAAEAAGASAREVEAIIQQPIIMPTPIAPPTIRGVEGISARETWRAEVTDKAALIRAAAANAQFQALLEVNQVALNGLARSLKSAMNVPGVRAVREAGIAVRRN